MTKEPTEWRALCAELADYLQGRKDLECGWPGEDPEQDLLDHARAALSQSEPEGPTDEELLQIAAATIDPYESCGIAIGEEVYGSELIAFARAVLARYARPTIEPVPVAERLPGAGDCDANELCWWWCHHYESWQLDHAAHYRHWLPHHALPVPTP